MRIREREQKLLKKIDEALDRMKLNTYGICERCEEEIPYKRLKARPVTTLCIDCKTLQEQEERGRRKLIARRIPESPRRIFTASVLTS